MPIVVGTSQIKCHSYLFTVDFGSGPVAVQKCGEIYATSERTRLTIERGLSHCRLFSDLYAAEMKREAAPRAVPRLTGLPVSIVQMNRLREALVTYSLSDAHVVAYSVGPWNNEESNFTMERLVIEYAGFRRGRED
jgi:hypothetical protein